MMVTLFSLFAVTISKQQASPLEAKQVYQNYMNEMDQIVADLQKRKQNTGDVKELAKLLPPVPELPALPPTPEMGITGSPRTNGGHKRRARATVSKERIYPELNERQRAFAEKYVKYVEDQMKMEKNKSKTNNQTTTEPTKTTIYSSDQQAVPNAGKAYQAVTAEVPSFMTKRSRAAQGGLLGLAFIAVVVFLR